MIYPSDFADAFAMRAPCAEKLLGTPDRAGEQVYLDDQSQTAKALGMTVPPALLSLADGIIE